MNQRSGWGEITFTYSDGVLSMMTRSLSTKVAATFGILLLAGAVPAQNYYVPGSYQAKAGLGGDWDPPNAPQMTETAAGSNIFNLDFTLTDTPAGTGFAFKILNSPDNSPAWGDPEVTPNDVPFDAAADPAAMASAIEAALQSTGDNARRVAAAKAWADEHFTIERMTSEYLALFERIATGGRRSRAA